MPAILGRSKWAGQRYAYHHLREETEELDKPELRRGKMLEPSVLGLWGGYESKVVCSGGRIESPALTWAHATIDAKCDIARLASLPLWLLLEAKTAVWSDAWGQDGSDRIPEEYALQCTWYAGVARAAGWRVAEWVEVPALLGHYQALEAACVVVEAQGGAPLKPEQAERLGLELRVYRVPWEPRLFEAVKERVLAFLEAHVWPGVPPQLTAAEEALERDRQAVAKAYKAKDGLVLEWEQLGPGPQADLRELVEASAQRKAWAGVEEQAKARVQAWMGEAVAVRGLPGGERVTWGASGSGRRFLVSGGGEK